MINGGLADVSISKHNITVKKGLDKTGFRVPVIMFTITSTADQPTTLRLVETIPSQISIDKIGFRKEFGSEHWSTDERTLVFEREFDPGEEYTTLYGIRNVSERDLDAFLTDPSIEIIDDQFFGSDTPDELDFPEEPQEELQFDALETDDQESSGEPHLETEPVQEQLTSCRQDIDELSTQVDTIEAKIENNTDAIKALDSTVTELRDAVKYMLDKIN